MTGIEGLEPVKIVLSIVHMLMPVFMHAWKNNRHLYAEPRAHDATDHSAYDFKALGLGIKYVFRGFV